MAEKDCEGQCPYCDSDNMDFIEVIEASYDDYLIERWTCGECSRDFNVIYVLSAVYSYTEYEEIDLDDKTLWDK